MRYFNKLLYTVLFPSIAFHGYGNSPVIPLESPDWEMVWSDEFSAPEIDTTKWRHIDKGDGFGNQELQYYTPRKKNSFIKDGKLVIKAFKENYKGRAYTSAKLESRGEATFTYGKFSFRAKMPIGKGMWPALWMMPSDMNKLDGWPMCGEIDVMEYLGHEPNKIFGSLHFGDPWPNNAYTGGNYYLPSGTFHDDFHIFELIWIPGKIQWFVDGKLYSSKTKWYTAAPGQKPPAPYNYDFFLIMNLAVGGNLPGSPDATTKFPQTFEVDWVRVYKYNGEFPEIETPFNKAVSKIAPGFKLDNNGDYRLKGKPVDYLNQRITLKVLALDEKKPVSLSKSLKANKDTKLKFSISSQVGQKWQLVIKVNDKVIKKLKVMSKTETDWLDEVIDLSKYKGREITVKIENQKIGNRAKVGYISEIKLD